MLNLESEASGGMSDMINSPPLLKSKLSSALDLLCRTFLTLVETDSHSCLKHRECLFQQKLLS